MVSSRLGLSGQRKDLAMARPCYKMSVCLALIIEIGCTQRTLTPGEGAKRAVRAVSTLPTQPHIDGFAPYWGETGTLVTIRGAGLTSVVEVSFDGQPASILSASDRELQVFASAQGEI